MFERLQLAGLPVHMLSVQYRMHPEISAFPSKHFYEGKLQNSAHLETRPDILCLSQARTKDHSPDSATPTLTPLTFFSIQWSSEGRSGGSWGGRSNNSLRNVVEAQFATALCSTLIEIIAAYKAKTLAAGAPQHRHGGASIAVITPYALQVKELKHQLQLRLKEDCKHVDVNTVDGFQGREKDIVIFSCVRSHGASRDGGGIGFLSDIRRMNVAITRSTFHCFCVPFFTLQCMMWCSQASLEYAVMTLVLIAPFILLGCYHADVPFFNYYCCCFLQGPRPRCLSSATTSLWRQTRIGRVLSITSKGTAHL